MMDRSESRRWAAIAGRERPVVARNLSAEFEERFDESMRSLEEQQDEDEDDEFEDDEDNEPETDPIVGDASSKGAACSIETVEEQAKKSPLLIYDQKKQRPEQLLNAEASGDINKKKGTAADVARKGSVSDDSDDALMSDDEIDEIDDNDDDFEEEEEEDDDATEDYDGRGRYVVLRQDEDASQCEDLFYQPLPLPFTERRRLSECVEEDESEAEEDLKDPQTSMVSAKALEQFKKTLKTSDVISAEMIKKLPKTLDVTAEDLSKEIAIEDDKTEEDNNQEDNNPEDNQEDKPEARRHKFVVTKASAIAPHVEKELSRLTERQNSQTVHFPTSSCTARPQVRNIFGAASPHLDKRFFDSSLVEIRQKRLGDSAGALDGWKGQDPEQPAVIDDVWIKRGEAEQASKIAEGQPRKTVSCSFFEPGRPFGLIWKMSLQKPPSTLGPSPKSRKESVAATEPAPTLLNEEQIAEAQEAFQLFEKEGFMICKDLRTALRSLGYNTTDLEIEDLALDSDPENTGKLDFSQFLKAVERKINTFHNEEEIKQAFKVFDQNGDGMITASELRIVMNNLDEKLTDEEIEEMIREADLDGNGVIDYDEFVAMMTSGR